MRISSGEIDSACSRRSAALLGPLSETRNTLGQLIQAIAKVYGASGRLHELGITNEHPQLREFVTGLANEVMDAAGELGLLVAGLHSAGYENLASSAMSFSKTLVYDGVRVVMSLQDPEIKAHAALAPLVKVDRRDEILELLNQVSAAERNLHGEP